MILVVSPIFQDFGNIKHMQSIRQVTGRQATANAIGRGTLSAVSRGVLLILLSLVMVIYSFGVVAQSPAGKEPVSSVIVSNSANVTTNFAGNNWMSQGTWLFLHGMGSHPSVWGWVESFMQLDESVPRNDMTAPQLPNYEPLRN
jgi:hypothetical protein